MRYHETRIRSSITLRLTQGRRAFGLTALMLLPLVVGAADEAPTDVVAQRGNIKLTVAEVRDLIDHTDPGIRAQVQSSPAALAEFVRDRLLRETLLTEAHASNFDQKPDIVSRANEARDSVVVQSYLISRVTPDPNFPSAAEIAAAYDANKARFAVPKQYHIAQIAVLVPAGAAKDVEDEARRKAADLRAQAVKPKADFAELAKKNSQDRPSADRGGDMGWLREDQLTPPVRDALASLADNAISQPIRSTEAWHVVKLLEVKPPSMLPLEQVRDGLVQALRQARTQQEARNYVNDLLRKEPIQLNEIDLARRLAASH